MLALGGCNNNDNLEDSTKKGELLDVDSEYVIATDTDPKANNKWGIILKFPDSSWQLISEKSNIIHFVDGNDNDYYMVLNGTPTDNLNDVFNVASLYAEKKIGQVVSYSATTIRGDEVIVGTVNGTISTYNIVSAIYEDIPVSIIGENTKDACYDILEFITFNNIIKENNVKEYVKVMPEASNDIGYEYPATWVEKKSGYISYVCKDNLLLNGSSISITSFSKELDNDKLDYDIDIDYSKIFENAYDIPVADYYFTTDNEDRFSRTYVSDSYQIGVDEDYNSARPIENESGIKMIRTSARASVNAKASDGYAIVDAIGSEFNIETYYFVKDGLNYQVVFIYSDNMETTIEPIINRFIRHIF